MTKVGLLTFHRSTNFGSYLQAYALYHKICYLGCDCEVIDYRCPAIERREGLAAKIHGPRDLAKKNPIWACPKEEKVGAQQVRFSQYGVFPASLSRRRSYPWRKL